MTLHINKPRNQTYTVHVRQSGKRRYFRVSKEDFPNKESALVKLGSVFASGLYKRGIILMHEEEPSYYDPSVVVEWYSK